VAKPPPRPPIYSVVSFDAFASPATTGQENVVLALNPDVEKEVLGLCAGQTESTKHWLKVINELKARATNDALTAIVEGPQGLCGSGRGVSADSCANLPIR
jgi:putative transposase